MNGDSTVTIGLIVLVIGCLINVWGFIRANKSDTKADSEALFTIKESLIKANSKLDDQCNRIQDLQVDIKSTGKDIDRMREVQIRQDMEIKAIWKRIDEMKEEN